MSKVEHSNIYTLLVRERIPREQITTVVLNTGETTIIKEAFKGFSSLTQLTIGELPKSQNTGTDFSIPDGILSIGKDSFEGCTQFISLTISKSVTSIKPTAFSGCTSVSSVTMPGFISNENLAYLIFYGCTKLNTIKFSTAYTVSVSEKIPKEQIKTDVLNSGETSIPENGFTGFTSLTSLTIGETPEKIFAFT